MIDSGSVTIEGVSAKKGTDKQSGIHIRFSQTVEGNASEVHKSAAHRERHGKLALKVDGQLKTFSGKLSACTTYAEKIDETSKTNYTFVPSERPTKKVFTALYDSIDEVVDFTFEDQQKEIIFPEEAQEPVEAATDLE